MTSLNWLLDVLLIFWLFVVLFTYANETMTTFISVTSLPQYRKIAIIFVLGKMSGGVKDRQTDGPTDGYKKQLKMTYGNWCTNVRIKRRLYQKMQIPQIETFTNIPSFQEQLTLKSAAGGFWLEIMSSVSSSQPRRDSRASSSFPACSKAPSRRWSRSETWIFLREFTWIMELMKFDEFSKPFSSRDNEKRWSTIVTPSTVHCP